MKKKRATKVVSTIRIEKVSVAPTKRRDTAFSEFVIALKDLEVGESFVYKIRNHHRVALSALQIALERSFITNSESGGMYRVGRVG